MQENMTPKMNAEFLRSVAQNDYMINERFLPTGERLNALATALETATTGWHDVNQKLADELEAAGVEDLLDSDLLDRVTAALRVSPSEPARDDARDAARYRWVRVSKLLPNILAHELDAAVDKAMAQAGMRPEEPSGDGSNNT